MEQAVGSREITPFELYLRSGVRVVSLYPGDLNDLGSALGSKIGQP
ncbi:MAG: hypothetical protein JRN62_09880 [Nitrososphaerota archaeon]|nr:hypothetical protein [Nitrososphaerota archaeon]